MLRHPIVVHVITMVPCLWYYAFRPYGNYYNNEYPRAGYYSGDIHESSNIGSNGFKVAVSRGDFGHALFVCHHRKVDSSWKTTSLSNGYRLAIHHSQRTT